MAINKKAQEGETLIGGFLLTDPEGIGPVAEHPRSDELSPAASPTLPHPRPWTKLPRVRRSKVAIMAMGKEILKKGDPRYYRALRLANAYRKQRTSELAAMHGHVSSGVSTLLANASMAWAASRFLYERFGSDESEPGAGQIETLKAAAKMAADARAHELAAWEMAAREGVLKRKQDSQYEAMPWLKTGHEEWKEKKKPGRKTNQERHQLANDTPPVVSPRDVTVEDLMPKDPSDV